MAREPLQSVTIIFSPYHVGIRDLEVGAGPNRLRDRGLVTAIKALGLRTKEINIEPVDDAEGDIGRSFANFKHIAHAVTAARDSHSFPIVVSGNCGAEVGTMAGITGSKGCQNEEVGCVWFDAHDDFNIPDTVLSGYFDSMPLAIMAGQCWKALTQTVPGYRPLKVENIVHCGMRDVNDLEWARVADAGFPVVWGRTDRRVDFASELRQVFSESPMGLATIHVDLDCLDSSVGQVNKYEPTDGGLHVDDLMKCIKWLSANVESVSLTVASYDPAFDQNDRIADIGIRCILTMLSGLLEAGTLVPFDEAE